MKTFRDRLEAIYDTISRCEDFGDPTRLCLHCEEKKDLISIACGWAFDQGVAEGYGWFDMDEHSCWFHLDMTGTCFHCGAKP